MIVTRFAPSPNGPLHWGHAYSAIIAHDLAAEQGGRFLLRIEDIDGPRSRPDLPDAFRRDLEWLGLEWDEVPAQSARLESYAGAAESLRERGLLYPCTCTRKDIEAAGAKPGPEGLVYPGTCKGKDVDLSQPAALRLDVEQALAEVGALMWQDSLAGEQTAEPHALGDVVLVRKDLPASYHLAATLDDAADRVTLVTRGQDLFAATHIHRLLQELLGLPVPGWHHHGLLLDGAGKKLAKTRGSKALADYRKAGENSRDWADRLRMDHWPCGISLGST
ncbi:tRNA glutamyl-Q(34) synthetase GluQRS [Parerythrobacter jejuensis]|uniref:tRNA glutamyl-Q(34) synthetase GluQRS n=1 Tax=Parerythrobacter jejuensis TaxID=795812 RepID=A0A845AKE0_9SPHN|nr:tRNA glutamyl-Q(34) synthetase GluQRS [Parerythrobacter jejuensis]MXP30730.1 tRNA glutamyl-Q(34) synthetase GluQRS [Parerythrobacter jejuensis]MXP33490.1 tRNA glutamyl-Q(34) synthetase GluQRS [Parerythrobacter jejuensis]